MYTSLFRNSKGALLFAGVVLFSAVAMVGTSDEGGMLPKLAERFGSRPSAPPSPPPSEAEVPREAAAERKSVPGWNDPPPSVFGEYRPGQSGGPPAPSRAPSWNPNPAAKPPVDAMHAPLSPEAIITN